ncbi:MAG: NAD(P)H-hydrate dehydratase [Methanosphaera sp.]|nr:NAD(P)H-hydrate dehydratase [Methanosphaera sp.]
MKEVLTPVEMRCVDKNTEYNGLPTLALMENAGSKIASYIIENYPDKKRISLYSGTGGNGGDAFVAARHLLNHGYKVHLVLLSKPENIKNSDSMLNWNVITNIKKADKNITISIITDSTQLKPDNGDIIVDAILGTGIKGKLRQPVSKAIDIINYSPAIRLSVDIPSGMDSLTGEVFDKCVVAHKTLTLHKKKTGLEKAQSSYVGEIVVLDIGVPRVSEEYVGEGDLLKIPKVDAHSHKGQNGSILIVGSNHDYVGAVIFAANAALKSGVDLVYIVAPESAADIIKGYNPEFIVRKVRGDKLDMDNYDDVVELSKKVDSILIGSGSGLDEKTGELYNKMVEDIDNPIVIDADALKLVDKDNCVKANTILTPHHAEFEKFFSIKLPVDFDEKIDLLKKLSKEYDTTTVLKGPKDIITYGDEYKLNDTGNAGMTVGGTGDILAGMITAYATKMNSFDAACISTFTLGQVADKLLDELGYNYTANDIIERL